MNSKQLRLIDTLAEEMLSAGDAAALMQWLARELVRTFSFRVAVVTQYDESRNGFVVLGFAPKSTISRIATSTLGIRVEGFLFPYSPEKSAVHEILGQGRRWVGTDFGALLAPLFPSRLARAAQKLAGVRGIYNAPLFSSGRLLGTIIVGHTSETFSESELSFLSTVTHHAAVAVHQATLLEEKKRIAEQYRLLTEVDREILDQTDTPKVLDAIAQNVSRVVPSDVVEIFVYDEQRQTFRQLVMHAVAKRKTVYVVPELKFGEGLVGAVGRSRKAEIINNAQRDPRSVYRRGKKPKTEHLILIPLLARNHTLGLLVLSRYSDRPFLPSDLEVAQKLGEKSAQALDNALLFTELRERERELASLNSVSATLARSIDLRTVLDSAMAEAIRLVPAAERGSILLVDEGENELYVATSYGYGPGVKEEFRLAIGQGVAGHVVEEGKGMVVADVSRERWFSKFPRLKQTMQIKSMLAVPLMLKGNSLGVVALDSASRTGAFTERDLLRLEIFASHAALAISNARLHAGARHELEKVRLLNEIKGFVRSQATIPAILQLITQRVSETFGYHLVRAYLVDTTAKDLRLVALSGEQANMVPPRHRVAIGSGIIGWVARHGQHRLAQDIESDPQYVRLGNVGTRSELCVPILDPHRAVLGVLDVQSRAPHAFSETDVATLEAVVHEIAGIMEERRLLDALQSSERRYRTLVENAAEAVLLIDPEGRFQFINRRGETATGYSLQQLMGKPFDIVVVPEDRAILREWFVDALAGRAKRSRLRFRIRSKSGERRIVELGGRVLHEKGKAVGILCVGRDVTNEVELRRKFEESERRYADFVRNSSEGIWHVSFTPPIPVTVTEDEFVRLYNERGRMTDANPALAEMYGLARPEEMVNASWQFWVVDRAEHDEGIRAFYRNGFRLIDRVSKERDHDGNVKYFRNSYFGEVNDGVLAGIWGTQADITEQRLAQQALFESEEKYRNLVEDAIVGVYIIQDGKFRFVNKRFAETFGYSVDELLAGVSVDDLVIPEDRTLVRENLRKRLGGEKKSLRYSFRCLRKDGQQIDVEVYGTASIYRGRPAIIGTLLDRTQEKQWLREIEAWRRRYDLIVASSGQIVYEYDTKTGSIVWSGSVERVLGYPVHEMGGGFERWKSLVHPEDRDEAVRAVERAEVDRSPLDITYRFRRKDGTYLWVQDRAYFVREEDGATATMMGMMEDITDKRRAQEEVDKIFQIAARFHGVELFDGAAQVVAQLLDMAYAVVGEYSDDGSKILARTFYEKGTLSHVFDYDLAGTPAEQILRTGEGLVLSHDATSRFPENRVFRERSVESYIGVPMKDGKGTVIGIVSVFDSRPHNFSEHEKKLLSIIAQRLSSELEMMKQRKREEELSLQLLHSQKMESLGTLAGGIAHDFNNILGAVLGYSTLVKSQIEGSSPLYRYVDAIEKSAQRAAELSKQLLGFAHKAYGEIRNVSINQLVTETLSIVSSSFPKTITIRTHLAPDLPPVAGDPGQLTQVVLNLCINARDAMMQPDTRSGTGTLTVETALFRPDESFAQAYLDGRGGEFIRLTITDTGVGIDPRVRDRVFEPFYTTKGKGKGTGLGLSMAYAIVRSHNGLIDFSSQPEKGTTFRVILPVSTVEGYPEAVSLSDTEVDDGHGETILVIDDESLMRAVVNDVLSHHNYRVLLAANGREGVDLFKKEQESIDLILLDMIMPEMDGPQTFAALRAIDRNVRVLVSSGFTEDAAVQNLLQQGALGFVAKPYRSHDLLRMVSMALKNKNLAKQASDRNEQAGRTS